MDTSCWGEANRLIRQNKKAAKRNILYNFSFLGINTIILPAEFEPLGSRGFPGESRMVLLK
jgi:hypothetical protein